MNNYIIHKAFDTKLETLADSLSLPVAWENIQTTPPLDGIFLEADFLPAENDSFAIQGRAVIRRGVYQVTVVYPIDGGTQAAEKIVTAVIEAFPENEELKTEAGSIYVNGEPSAFTGIRDDTGYRLPISIAYVTTA